MAAATPALPPCITCMRRQQSPNLERSGRVFHRRGVVRSHGPVGHRSLRHLAERLPNSMTYAIDHERRADRHHQLRPLRGRLGHHRPELVQPGSSSRPTRRARPSWQRPATPAPRTATQAHRPPRAWPSTIPPARPMSPPWAAPMFNGDAEATGSGATWAATQYWKGTSGSDVISSALSYIPEAAWNDASAGYFGGGGGGASAFFTKPAWQVETGASGMTTQVPPDGARDVPDLALDASDVHDPYLFCVASPPDSCGNGFRISSTNNGLEAPEAPPSTRRSSAACWPSSSRRSAPGSAISTPPSTPWATRPPTTTPPPAASSTMSPRAAMPCNVPRDRWTAPPAAPLGYSAGTGYDLATGWGSVDLNNLATDWTLVTPLGLGSLGRQPLDHQRSRPRPPHPRQPASPSRPPRRSPSP